MSRKIHIIGCGGVGSWLAPSLCMLVKPENVVLIDGDKLEHKNLNRQLFTVDEVGQFKAAALSQKYGCAFLNQWYSAGLMEHDRSDWLFCCADNHPARMAVLDSVDRFGCQAIIAANETTSSEAYYYRRSWKGTELDPRIYYPTMVSDHSGDPRAEAIGCTGEAQEQNPQLSSANFSAAALAQNLFVLWGLKGSIVTREMIPNLPFKYVANLSKLESHKIEHRAERKVAA